MALPKLTTTDKKLIAEAGFALDQQKSRPDLLIFRPTNPRASRQDYVEIEVDRNSFEVHVDAHTIGGQEVLVAGQKFRTLTAALTFVRELFN